MKLLFMRFWLVKASALLFLFISQSTVAQITPDATLPVNSRVTQQGNTNLIEQGTTAGTNLFHSFESFSVPTGGTAFFNNALNIQNIISRVTGKSISNIDGLIRASGTANLFLINPNGIVFAQNAKLDIGGSFLASTANAIEFGNQGFFSASNPEASLPLLTVNPSALFFNSLATAPIQVNSVAPSELDPSSTFTANGLRVPDGQGLFLVGGNVSINGGGVRGGLFAFGGRVELGGLAGAGTVGLNGNGSNLSLSFPDGIAQSDVALTNLSQVNVRADNGGSIAINAKNVELAQGSALRAGILTGLGSVNSKAGNIEVNAQAAVNFKDGSFISNALFPGATGKSGDVNITTGSLYLTNGSQVSAGTDGQGDGGKVTITAKNFISFDGVDSEGYPSGVLNGTGYKAVGNGGEINITTDSLSLTNGAKISTRTYGIGDAGSIIITAKDSISFDGVGMDNEEPSGTFSSVRPEAVGNAGNIRITTGSLSLNNGAQLSASNNERGTAGDIEVTSSSIRLDNKAAILTTTASGNGGNINLGIKDFLLLRRSSQISTSAGTAAAGGNGGNININAPNGFLLGVKDENSDISANAFRGSGGKVQIEAFGIFNIEQRSREDLVRRLETDNPSQINAQDLESNDITAVSQQNAALSGQVNINTPQVDPSSGLVELPDNVSDRSNLIAQACPPSQGNTFTITGRGGLPPLPTEALRSNQTATINWVTLGSQRRAEVTNVVRAASPTKEATGVERERPGERIRITKVSPFKLPNQMVAATGWVINNKGEVTLIASAPSIHGNKFLSSPTTCPN